MTSKSGSEVAVALDGLAGLSCWYVNAGGAAGSSFSLALGAKVRREVPLRNPSVSEDFRTYEGVANLLVWCSWRLDGPADAVASSDESADVIARKLTVLVGQSVIKVDVLSRAYDLRLTFDDFVLTVFCDHVVGDPSFDGNWQLSFGGQIFACGPGFKLEVVPDEA